MCTAIMDEISLCITSPHLATKLVGFSSQLLFLSVAKTSLTSAYILFIH
jgi:hypothetical protein